MGGDIFRNLFGLVSLLLLVPPPTSHYPPKPKLILIFVLVGKCGKDVEC